MRGLRKHGPARCRLRVPDLPADLRAGVRELTALEVPEPERRRGYGSALVAKVAREADRKRKVLLVRLDDAGLVPFYARHGFMVIQGTPLLMSRPCHG